MISSAESLKQIEKRAFRAILNDGLFDIFFGTLFLFLAFLPVLESVGISKTYGYLLGAFYAILLWVGRRLITAPRIGRVEYGQSRRKKNLAMTIICIAIFVLTLPLLIMTLAQGVSFGSGASPSVMLTVGPIIALYIAIAGYFLEYPRLYLYAAVLVFGLVQIEFLHSIVGRPLDSLIGFGISGSVILIYGIGLFLKFLKDHPMPNSEADRVEQ